jgi:hypothetical protein
VKRKRKEMMRMRMSKKAKRNKLTLNKAKIHKRKWMKAMMITKKMKIKMKIKTQMNNRMSHRHQWPRQKKVKSLNPKLGKPLNRANPDKSRKRKSN